VPAADDAATTPRAQARAHRVVVAAVLLEGLALLGVGAWQVAGIVSEGFDDDGVALGSSVYFLLVGGLVLGLLVPVVRRRSWAYGAALFLQVLGLPLAATMAGEGFWVGAVPLGLVALAAAWALVSAPGRAAFGRG
jgi:hypothetical protein